MEIKEKTNEAREQALEIEESLASGPANYTGCSDPPVFFGGWIAGFALPVQE